MTCKTRLDAVRFVTNAAPVKLLYLTVCTLVHLQIVSRTKFFPTFALVFSLLKMHGLLVSIAMCLLAKSPVTVPATPVLFFLVSGRDMPC